MKTGNPRAGLDYILSQGISQVEAGASILDVNMGMPGIDEAQMLPLVVKKLQSVLDTPITVGFLQPAGGRGSASYL